MFKRLKALFAKIKHYFSHSNCYNQMEAAGIATFGMCSGLSGGDKYSGYLQYECIDCPYFVDVTERAEKIFSLQKRGNINEKDAMH